MRYEPRQEQAVPARELTLIDICYMAGVNLALVDVLRGAVFQGAWPAACPQGR